MALPRRRRGEAWSNWGGNQTCYPASVAQPATISEIVGAVKQAASKGQRVKVVGAGHSFTGIALTDGVQLDLSRHCRLLEVDRERQRVKVQAGLPLWRLSNSLAASGMALENLGDIAKQSVAGAISTSTHGTGAAFGGLATQVEGLELVLADGSVVDCSAAEEPELFAAARVGLGALGIISAVTLRTVPAFNLRAREAHESLPRVLDGLDETVAGADHFEFYWVPHTRGTLTKRNERTSDPPGGRGRFGEVRDRVLLENVAFGAVCRLGRLVPALVPRLAHLAIGGGPRTYVERSYNVFASPRWVHFVEMEYALPRKAVKTALEQLVALIDDRGWRISFPVEVRFTAGDDIPLSTASGRDSAYIAVHQYRGVPFEEYFRAVEAIMMPLEGRPHWGKMHYQDAASLAPRYPQWERWQAVRRRVDPEGRFANDYLDRVIGSP